MSRNIVTPRQRIDQMLDQYATLDRDAHELIDAAVAELAITHPGVPIGSIKRCEFTNRAGYMLNVPEALRLLRERFRA
jgi:hypothetical protein